MLHVLKPQTGSGMLARSTGEVGCSYHVTQQPMRRPAGTLRAAGWRQVRDTAASTETGTSRSKYFTTADRRPIILFDGVCNLCNGGVNVMLDWDKAGEYRFAALQSDAGKALLRRSGRREDDISSIVLVEPDVSYIKSEAILRIARRLAIPLNLLSSLALPLPLLIRDSFYDQVANNRYNIFGRTDSCRMKDKAHEDRFIEA